MTTTCAEQQTQVASLESDKQALKQRCDDHEEGRRAEITAAQTLRQKIVALEQENQSLNAREKDLHSQCKQQQSQINTLESEKLVFVQQCVSTGEELRIKEDTNRAVTHENTDLRQEKELLNQENQQLKERREELEMLCEQQQIQINTLESQNQTLEERCKKYEAELQSARGINYALGEENAACKEQKKLADKENQSLAQGLATIKSALVPAKKPGSK